MKDTTVVSVGLFAAWVVHDIEELLTMRTTSRRVLQRSPRWVPLPPELERRGISQAQVNLTVALMAPVVAAAAWRGAVTECRSPFFRGAVLGFGFHGLAHLAGSFVAQGYTTGLLTTPTVVLPFWRKAHTLLRRKNLLNDAPILTTIIALCGLPLLGGVHVIAWRIFGDRALGEK